MTYRDVQMKMSQQMPELGEYLETSNEGILQSMMTNQSPVMKFWFVMMAANLGLILLSL